MGTLEVLGAAEVTGQRYAGIIADLLDVPQVEVLSCEAEEFPYDLEALTTGGRYLLTGTARAGSQVLPFRVFVKVVRSFARSPIFALVPEPLRLEALRTLPWQLEPEIYRSNLADALPVGLRLPRVVAVIDLDDESAAIWLEAVDIEPVVWDVSRHVRAAGLLGRLAASPRVAPLSVAVLNPRTVRDYVNGRVAHVLTPALLGDDLWQHPIVAGAFDAGLRGRIMHALADLPDHLAELECVPLVTSHGDACTRNLLVNPGQEGFTLIDFGFWGRMPVGHDLGQLLLGEVQMGERPASQLPELEAACLPAYVEGLRAEGLSLPIALVRRAHALLMLIFSGISAVPFEFLGGPPTAERQRIALERAGSARFILDLVDDTEPIPW